MRYEANLLLGLAIAPLGLAFNAYTAYPTEILAHSLNVSTDCLSAINETVACNAILASRSINRNEKKDIWIDKEVSTLCTSECADSLSTWLSNVKYACYNDRININGTIVEPSHLPLKYISGYNTVCSKDSAGKRCLLESQRWSGFKKNSIYKITSEECYGERTPKHCSKEMVDITRVYPQKEHCSECFFRLWKQRLVSPSLRNGTYRDYLQHQFQLLSAKCPDMAQRIQYQDGELLEKLVPRKVGPQTFARVPSYVPILPQTTKNCSLWYRVEDKDRCSTISEYFGVTLKSLQELNPAINKHCTGLWANYAICLSKSKKIQQNGGFPLRSQKGGRITSDGTCGSNVFCEGSKFGHCCSTSGYCGAGPKYCGVGNCLNGECETDDGGVSTNGTCGPKFPGNKTCLGSDFGNCCSIFGFCGSTEKFCGASICYSGECQNSDNDD